MKFSLLLFLSVTLLAVACSHSSKVSSIMRSNPPGTIPLNDTLLCDVTESTNFHWLEFLYWTSRAYGENSPEYQKILPVADAWSEFACLDDYDEAYLRHVAYRDYPVVGISQEQAMLFAKWRSDRVFEYTLIRDEFIEYDTIYTNIFTIEGYFNGSWTPAYLKTDPTRIFIRDTSLHYPAYRLPSLLDRAIILDYADSTDFMFSQAYPKKEKKWMYENPIPLYLELNPCDTTAFLIEPVVDVDHGYPEMKRIKFLYNIRGNVAEWSSETDLTFGGGWPHTRSYVFKHDTISASSPNAWTGFRNVCTWKKFDFGD